MNYILKHLKLIKPYFSIGLKIATEYKFQFITNFLTYIVVAAIWIFLWSLMFSNIQEIGNWSLPMLIMMVGFFQVAEAIWQFGFYTLGISREIISGRVDKYLVRPINPLYGIIMEKFEIVAFLPLVMGLGIILYANIKYLSLDLIKISLALFTVMIGISILQVIYSLLGILTFWIGDSRGFQRLHRSTRVLNNFPLDIMNKVMTGVLMFLAPIIFFGTYPVLMVTNWPISTSLKIIALAFSILIFWSIVLYFLWKRGIKKYESMGG
jgi:ABC-2 type transport system permease protein